MKNSSGNKAEFDSFADNYHDMHKRNIEITGEEPEYFSEYKIADLASWVLQTGHSVRTILDFGSGVGNSIPYFRKYFSESTLTCADVSARSIELAKERFPGNEDFICLEDERELPEESFDIVFSACVFHHIPHSAHVDHLQKLCRATRPGGILVIFEHNPLNPLTVRAVNTCPLDENAELITASKLRTEVRMAGWKEPEIKYKLFFPSFMSKLRPLEPRLAWCALGAQYRLTARK